MKGYTEYDSGKREREEMRKEKDMNGLQEKDMNEWGREREEGKARRYEGEKLRWKDKRVWNEKGRSKWERSYIARDKKGRQKKGRGLMP